MISYSVTKDDAYGISALKRGLSYAFGVVRGPKGAPFGIKTPSKKDQHLCILHSVTLKFQGRRGAGNVWTVGNVRCELTTGKEGA